MNDQNNLLVRALYEVFGEHDAFNRKKNIQEIWAEECLFVDPDGEHRGHQALNEAVEALHEKTPGFAFSERAPVNGHHDVARLLWAYGPSDQPHTVTGMDVAVFADGKIQKMYTFLD